MTFAAADMTEEGLAALRDGERRSDLLLLLGEFAEGAARVVGACAEAGSGPEETRSVLSFVAGVLLHAAGRLIDLSLRLWAGRRLPRPRKPGPEPDAGRPDAEPRERSVWERSVWERSVWARARFADLVALGVPGAEALRDRLAALLAEPETAELVASEPAVWRAAFPLARAFGLKVPPRPPAADPEPDDAPGEPAVRAARPRPEAPPPPARAAQPEARWYQFRPGGGADPPSRGR